MNPDLVQRITAALAAERLDSYRHDGVTPEVALARYLLNIALCEALYPALQLAEVALRNTIHHSLRARYATDLWFESPRVPMSDWQKERVADARAQLSVAGKPVTAGRLVAELNFGFWTGFFNKHQARTGLGFHLARSALPSAPREERDLSKLDARWAAIRDLRNRVFHHERIVHFVDLDAKHQLILQSIQWISPELHELTAALDRFPQVRADGLTPWLARVRHRWPDHP